MSRYLQKIDSNHNINIIDTKDAFLSTDRRILTREEVEKIVANHSRLIEALEKAGREIVNLNPHSEMVKEINLLLREVK